MGATRTGLIWGALATALCAPLLAAGFSPLLQYRQPIYIIAGFAGIAGLALLLLQPILAGNYLPDISAKRARKIHKIIGIALVLMVLAHVIGLWITSPPDVIDALLFRSPTPFSIWGVTAMWAVFATAILAALRRKLRIRLHSWRYAHMMLAVIIVIGTVVHALMIDGTMEFYTKIALCALVVVATAIRAKQLFFKS
ncbi:ferric reductase-like transmembrane domain-containing protein [Ahrensia marina]|uniref:Ferric reductase n=1 Tax=Ahrensia marina TaxID=1514904 RepID=A0A0M9GN06_9HYPH|nr:ferric reductase-like transmembrane domain-containing protein [Ahrensia marina]KPB01309.1 ferric reductase [Ahrensia marina]